MTLAEIKNQVMFQTNNDADDLGDYEPHINDYVNDGYDRIIYVWDKKHVPCEEYPRLENNDDVPNIPEWIHRYLCDWATWLIYRNGNPQKQNRGMAYRANFEVLLSDIISSGGKNGMNADGSQKKFDRSVNIPR